MILILSLNIGCSIKNISYDRKKITEKYLTEYDFFIDSEKSDFENIYLDKENIKNIKVNKTEKTININQIKQTELFELRKMKIDSLSSKLKKLNQNEIGLIIFNGIPIKEVEKSKIKFDPNSIKVFEILLRDRIKNSTWYDYTGDILLITTD